MIQFLVIEPSGDGDPARSAPEMAGLETRIAIGRDESEPIGGDR